MTKQEEIASFDFKAVTHDEFELSVTFQVKSTVIQKLIGTAHRALRMKGHAMPVEHELEGILDKHELPSQYHRLVHTSLKPVLKNVYEQVGQDGIVILREEPSKVLFYKKEGQWFIEMVLKGTYHKN